MRIPIPSKKVRHTIPRLRNQADKIWFQRIMSMYNWICEVCYQPAQQAHHFFPKGQFGHLRYTLDNGICICNACHFAHTHKGDPTIHARIIERRGKDWYSKLEKEKRKTPSSYQTVGYYKSKIEQLQ